MKEVIIVYGCDTWHTHTSKYVIGVCDSFDSVINLLKKYIKKWKTRPLTEYNIDQLKTIQQTQNYRGEGEFILETYTLNIF